MHRITDSFFLLPRTVYGQMIAIMIASMLATISVVAFLIMALRASPPATRDAIVHVLVLSWRILQARPRNRHVLINESTCAANASSMTPTHIGMPCEGIFIAADNHRLPLTVSFLSLWSLYRVNLPLKLLAKKADTFDHDVIPLTEQGPVVPRRVTRALHRIQPYLISKYRSHQRMSLDVLAEHI